MKSLHKIITPIEATYEQLWATNVLKKHYSVHNVQVRKGQTQHIFYKQNDWGDRADWVSIPIDYLLERRGSVFNADKVRESLVPEENE